MGNIKTLGPVQGAGLLFPILISIIRCISTNRIHLHIHIHLQIYSLSLVIVLRNSFSFSSDVKTMLVNALEFVAIIILYMADLVRYSLCVLCIYRHHTCIQHNLHVYLWSFSQIPHHTNEMESIIYISEQDFCTVFLFLFSFFTRRKCYWPNEMTIYKLKQRKRNATTLIVRIFFKRNAVNKSTLKLSDVIRRMTLFVAWCLNLQQLQSTCYGFFVSVYSTLMRFSWYCILYERDGCSIMQFIYFVVFPFAAAFEYLFFCAVVAMYLALDETITNRS